MGGAVPGAFPHLRSAASPGCDRQPHRGLSAMDGTSRMSRLVDTPAGPALQWRFKRNCSLTPRQSMASGLAILVFHAAVGGAFWALGYPAVACFAALESAVVAGCLLCYARHACDQEVLTLHGDQLAIEVHCGGRVQRTVLHAGWIRVEPPARPQALLSLAERGTEVRVGRHVQPRLREVMARELRQALHQQAARGFRPC
ncbi:MAG: DUF2244 domain-containing protein [Rubrivivax sp.]|nr:MAG: DUF2244 domain-containing protein [Rubrivivax sp.]